VTPRKQREGGHNPRASVDAGEPGPGERLMAAAAPRGDAAAGLAAPTAEPAPAGAVRGGLDLQTVGPWLVVGCYLLGALAVTARLWAVPAGRVPAGDPGDVDLGAWFLRYAATAVAHGRLPALVTTAMNAPQGINLMWNVSFLLPGVLFAPVTLLAGPQVSLTVVMTLGFAGSAASLFWVLRRWGASLGAAALGGAVYGFSPALVTAGAGHYHLQFAVLPPLIIDTAARLVTGRGRGVRTGAWLGLLCAAQLFISEELLVYTVVAGVILAAAVAVSRPRAVPRRARGTVTGLAAAVVVFLLLDGYALWVQFAGPLAEHSKLRASLTGNLSWFVVPSASVLFHTRASAAEAATTLTLPAEYLNYLGWPLIGVLVVAGVVFWRDLRVRAAAVTWAVLELCALGGGNLPIGGGLRWPGRLLPWHWVEGLPGLAQVLPWRFSILADGAAAAVLAFSLDRALAAVPRPEDRSGRPEWPGWRGWAGWWPRGALAGVALLAVLPLVPLPYKTATVPQAPAGWQATSTKLQLPSDAPVLILPFPSGGQTQVLRWQAETGYPSSMIGGYFLAPSASGQATFFFQGHSQQTEVATYLNEVWQGKHPRGPSAAEVRAVIGSWRTAAIVAVTGPQSPVARLLTRLFGRPAFHIGAVLSWRLRR
jgi:hypothetical protein